jgi:transcriptional regulator with XRE-family HTH domain
MAPGNTYREALAANFRAARARLGLKQEDVAARMQALGHDAWCHQTVGQIERGKRRLMAEEILGAALALETSISALMIPVAGYGTLMFPGGTAIIESLDSPIRWRES